MKTFFGLIIVIAACVPGPHVPSALQGNVPIRVADNTSAPVCVVGITPYGQPTSNDNWLGASFRHHPISPKSSREFMIKPGTYQIVAGACDNAWAGLAQKVEVERPTYVAFGPQGDAPPSYQVVSVAVRGLGGGAAAAPEQPDASGSGTEEDCKPDGAVVTDYNDCCTHNFNNVNGTYVCCDPSKGECK
jgi:hypothetical protein